MFDNYAKMLEEVGANVPEVFDNVAYKGSLYAEKKAKDITDQEALVDTGNYRRDWFGNKIEPQPNTYGVFLENDADYATFLEDGTGRGIKGRFVGRRALDETHVYCIELLDNEFEKAYKKYQRSFNE